MLPRLRCSSGVWKSLARMARPMTSQAHQESNVKQADITKENDASGLFLCDIRPIGFNSVVSVI